MADPASSGRLGSCTAGGVPVIEGIGNLIELSSPLEAT
jgi:hypothetical protein